ncbi:MAG: hypothetical protein GX806_02575 [Lentisphaerae bacterium]|nr:hypothetical protein [Lentisphaerota bacterium]
MFRKRCHKLGQAMTEYIIIVAIIALAALAIFGLFGDRIRAMVGGATEELGGDASAVQSAVGSEGDSLEHLRNLKPSGN